MIQIIPAILATTEQEYKEKLLKIEESESFQQDGWIQIDLMDNKFVQNQSIGVDVIAKYPTKLQREAQLMVEYPQSWIDDLLKSGIERIVFPVEDFPGIQETIDQIKNQGIQVGLSLNPETEVEKIEPFMSTIDLVLVMSVHPGFGGQEFIPESIDKIKEVSRLRSKDNLSFLIEVDGGVSEKVIPDLIKAGVDNLVIGSHLLEGNIDENIEKIWEALR